MIRLALLGTLATVASLSILWMLTVIVPGSDAAVIPSPWWSIALVVVGFVVAERFVFHLEFRLDAVVVSLSEVPVAFALVFLDLRTALVVRVVMGVIVTVTRRAPAFHKVMFNACVYTADVAIAWFIVRWLRHLFGDGAGVLIVSVSVATAVMSMVAALLVHTAISQFAGGFVQRVRDNLGPSLWVPALSGLMAGLTITPALLSPWLTPLALVPIAAMWVLVREHGKLRGRFVDLEAVHGFAAGIADVVVLQQMIDGAIVATADLLHARQASIVLFDNGAIVGSASHGTPAIDLPTGVDDATWSDVVSGGAARSRPVMRSDGSLAVAVRGSAGEVGVLVVKGREGSADAFGVDDARRLRTLADQLAAGIGRGLLHRRLEREARHDLLTGLPNRATFEAAVVERSASSGAHGLFFMVMFDLDRFKEVNDTLGHHAGDQVLVEFASRMSSLLDPDDLLSRFAGDEFALVGERATLEVIDQFLRACIDSTLRPFSLDGLEVVVTVSAGVAVLSPGDDSSLLVRKADVAMYHAKSQHLGYDFHREEIDRRTPARLSMLTDLRAAICSESVHLHFQPKLDLSSGRVSGVEALARWHHPTRGWVSPIDFIKVAEESGLIRSLTDHVIASGIAALSQLLHHGHEIGLALNLSTQDLFDELLADRVERRLEQFGVPADMLTMEITESSLLVDGPRTSATIERLHRIGLHLSIDDFGTGYSSLSYLRKLPVSELKIDRSFVTDLLTEHQDDVIVRSTIDLGHNLGMSVVAEGVESQAVVERLRAMGCDVVQGFWFARPMPLGALEPWLARNSEQTTEPTVRR